MLGVQGIYDQPLLTVPALPLPDGMARNSPS